MKLLNTDTIENNLAHHQYAPAQAQGCDCQQSDEAAPEHPRGCEGDGRASAVKSRVFRLFDEAFPQDRRWNRWFFDTVYRDADAMTLIEGGNTVSALLIQRYEFAFHGEELPMAYICGVCTSAAERGKGYISRLLHNAVTEAYERGYVLASVIPAEDRLYFLYDRFGFATTIYIDVERYTSAHQFESAGYVSVDCDYAMFKRLENLRSCGIRHDETQYRHILEDIAGDGGIVCGVRSDDGESEAIAFAVPEEWRDRVSVRELLSTDGKAAEAVLGQVRRHFADRGIDVSALPGGRRASLRARGMIRIVNVGKVLGALATDGMRDEQVIRVHDNLLPQNNGVYIVGNGRCRHVDSTMRRLTLDVDVSTLASILFSSESIGQVFGLRTSRAMMPLMLD